MAMLPSGSFCTTVHLRLAFYAAAMGAWLNSGVAVLEIALIFALKYENPHNHLFLVIIVLLGQINLGR